MRNKKLIFFVVGLLIVFSAVTFAETKKLKSIGRYTFVRVRGDIPTQEVMKTIVERYAADIKYGFDLAGYGDLYLPFIDQLKTATFQERSLPVGTKLMWMLFRSRGKVKIVQDLEWAGKQPLDVFSFKVKKDYKSFEFVMPKPCGNISLINIEELVVPAVCNIVVSPSKANVNDPITVDMSGSKEAKSMEVEVFDSAGTKVASHSFTPAAAKWQTSFDKPGEYVFKGKALNMDGVASTNPCDARVFINAPPTCKMWTSCLPCEDYVGKPITFDVTGSTDPDGEIAKATFELTDQAGNIIDTYVATSKPFTWERIFDKAGIYVISAVVFDDMGAASPTTDACRIMFEVTQKRLYWLAEAGPILCKGTYTTFGFGRLGALYSIVPGTLDFIATVGGAVPFYGDPWKFFFMGNALMNLHAGPAFFAGGLGFSTKDQNVRKGGIDLVGQVGFELFNLYNSMGSIFFEYRQPIITENRPTEEYHKFALGFRYLF